jgi:3-dehydroquinate synthase
MSGISLSPHVCQVTVSNLECQVVTGVDLFKLGSEHLSLISPALSDYHQVFIITDTHVAPSHLKTVRDLFQFLGVPQIEVLILEPGEAAKQIASANQLWTLLIEHRFTRDALLVALGGGVIGDLTGFVASTFFRGIACLQCPTSFLAQVDAGIGGKTAINHALGKNLIGTFHQPIAVINNLDFLKTLPDREYISALAEVVKYGLIADVDFLGWMEHNIPAILAREITAMHHIVSTCSQIKANTVNLDPNERTGHRACLNFGHTLAHALEALGQYTAFSHGEAVAVGMVFALKLSLQYGLAEPTLERIQSLLTKFGLPTCIPQGYDSERLIEYFWHDKKNSF